MQGGDALCATRGQSQSPLSRGVMGCRPEAAQVKGHQEILEQEQEELAICLQERHGKQNPGSHLPTSGPIRQRGEGGYNNLD